MRAALSPRRLAVSAAVVLTGLFVAGLLPAQSVRVSSDSMLPTLHGGDRVLLVHGARAGRGDVVALAEPGGSAVLVKRIVAVGGDRIEFDDGELLLNGVPVAEPYADRRLVDGMFAGPFAVPPGHVYLLGDNRGDSVDSRRFGPVPADAVIGRIIVRLWPQPGRI